MGKIVRAIKVEPHKKPEVCKRMKGKRILNKIVQNATGDEIDFPEVDKNEKVSPGDKATINNKPATGEFVMPDGSIYIFSAGKLKKIIPAGEDALAMIDRTAGTREYLASKRNKANPTATPENRFAGIPDRIKNLKRKNN